ncbi:MAG: ATP synthase subunit alpha [Candidatus Parcubacteria bacterium]|nr:MAG: ATP synthase subunit alpha [Candidatus Parcubacteria bacterium]
MDDIKFIIEKLKKSIDNLEIKAELNDIGKVIAFNDGVVLIDGLNEVQSMEILVVKKEKLNIKLLALNLEESLIGAVCLNNFDLLQHNDIVYRTKQVASIGVDERLLGRVINPLGDFLDNLSPIEFTNFYPIERSAPSVTERSPVSVPLHTGIKIIDSLIPIGRGQRELILGDRQTGKTSIALDVILNQKQDVFETPVCIYVAIGQKLSKIKRFYEILKKEGALDYTIIVATSSEDYPTLLYLAPYVGCALGEYFMDQGKDVLVIYDDLTKHAWAWREISLLLKRPVGREAYPGDIFYIHSRLLERAAKLNKGGSLTALPICETQLGDISAYIPTNLISITDGQIYLDNGLFKSNFRPAINIGLSVSRVGSKAQTKIIKKITGKMKLSLAQYRELESFAQLSTELPQEMHRILLRGKIILELLKQDNLHPLSFEKLAILMYAVQNGYFDDFNLQDIRLVESKLIDYLENDCSSLLAQIREVKDLTDDIEIAIKNALQNFFTFLTINNEKNIA